jgi:hypothetical protein
MAQATKNGSRSGAHTKRSGPQASNRHAADPAPSRSSGGLSDLAERAKGPALAGGAALAGLAGGLALGSRLDGSKKLLGVKVPARSRTQIATKNLAEAAKHAGSLGDQFGDLATEIRKVREGFEARGARSPIEVLLQGLTRRGGDR